jgi:hypothetical protein
MRLLRNLDLNQVHIVHHPTVRTDEAVIGKKSWIGMSRTLATTAFTSSLPRASTALR